MVDKRSASALTPPPTGSDSPPIATPSPKKAKSAKSTPTKTGQPDAWTPERRLKLFEAYQEVANVKWDDVAAKMGDGATGKMCREQWQRGMGKKIKGALAEK